MKKRVLAGIMMAVMMMASVMGVSAANSKDADLKVNGDTFVAEKVEDQSSLTASAAKESSVAGKTAISAVYDVKLKDGATATPDAAGKYTVELMVASLSDKCSDIVVLCYDAEDKTWASVAVDAANVDYTNKTVKVVLPYLGQIVVYASVAASGSTGTSPSTVGTSSTWMLYLAVALVVVGAGVVATQKKSR